MPLLGRFVMDGRFDRLTINTLEELKEQIDYVLAHPDIAGFDCMLARALLAVTPESKAAAVSYAMRGFKVSFQCETAVGSETHVLARVIVVPPLVIKADHSDHA